MKTTLAISVATLLLLCGCGPGYRNDLDYSYAVEQTCSVDELPFGDLVQYQSVDLDLIRTAAIRQAIVDDRVADGRVVLEIGSGTGLISVLCLNEGAKQVVATDVQPAAVANTLYNAASLVGNKKVDARLRPASSDDAFSAINADETFDLIIVDLDRIHWDRENNLDDHVDAKRDAFVITLMRGLGERLNAGGRCLALCGTKSMLARLSTAADSHAITWKNLDPRDATTLGEFFSPSMIIELRVTADKVAPVPPVEVDESESVGRSSAKT